MHHPTAMRILVFLGLALPALGANAQTMNKEHAKTYDKLRQALMAGQRVSATFDFSRCQPKLPQQAGLPIQEFMILPDHIAFSQKHPTVHTQDNNIINEFMRYTIFPETTKAITHDGIAGESAKVVMSAYSWKPGDSQAKPIATITCHIGNGAEFTW